ncbi:MAG: sugar-transfer associated ATP-grasp domain-containing protein [Clostridia bacterium]|nr:sugar-transfer associated ATP-grasp domain-containing protein [Clostridia bacterium]
MNRLKMILNQIVSVMRKSKGNKNSFILFFDIILCALLYGASPNNYYYYGFVHLNHKQRKTYVTNRLSCKIIKKFNDQSYIDNFERKEIFNQKFSKYIARAFLFLGNYTDKDFDEFYESVKDDKQVIYKPSSTAQGQGIEVLHFDNKQQLSEKIKNLHSDAVLEQWIKQNEQIKEIYDKSVNCIRIISLFNDNKTYILAANITFGKNGSEIANASLDNVVCIPDINTGIIKSDARDLSGREHKAHPDTGFVFKGYKIPYWDDIISMVQQASRVVPNVGYIG